MLVQYFLREVAKDTQIAGAYTPPKVTGTALSDTFDAILSYQQAANAQGAVLTPDGRIDPLPGNDAITSSSHRFYTILEINIRYAFLRPSDMLALGQASDIPRDLNNLIASFVGTS